ncbi:MAG: hypothetical protein DWQ37_00420 [Planctomycetota bacterium]|nr:MAG: hypothetical protein DWQ37_00420 [Planctomycetota bacterium]
MELREALMQIAEIRRQMSKADVFRGYRSAPVAVSGLLAVCGAVVQPYVAPDPISHLATYLALWIGMAVLSVAAVAVEMGVRMHLTHDWTYLEPTRLAVEQFIPPMLAGILVTVVLVRHAPENVSLLPGLWQILFSLGIFASARLLPRPIFAVAAFYLFTGIVALLWARDGFSLEPWCMGVPFAVGQLSSAAILYWTLERRA